MLSNHLILCHPLLLLPSIFPSIGVFSSESALWIRWPKYWSLSLSITLSNEYSGLISFRIDWFDLWALQGTLSLLFVFSLLIKLCFISRRMIWNTGKEDEHNKIFTNCDHKFKIYIYIYEIIHILNIFIWFIYIIYLYYLYIINLRYV